MDPRTAKLIQSIIILGFGLTAGYFYKKKLKDGEKISQILLKLVIVLLNPVINFFAIWGMQNLTLKLLMLPLIGIILTIFLFIPGLIIPRLLNLNRKQKGSFVLCTLISNIGYTMGGFLCYVFLGQEGYALSAIYMLYGFMLIYLVAFPLARYYSSTKNQGVFIIIKRNFTEPITAIPIFGLFMGFLFQYIKIPYPEAGSVILKYTIPAGTFGAFFAVGMKISFPPIRKFIKILSALALIKFLYNPIICQVTANVFSLPVLYKKVIFIESVMPVGIYSLIIALIYKLDEDIAKAGWVYTTIVAIILIPLIFLGISFI